MPITKLDEIREDIVSCRRCPRLVSWREEVAREKRRAFRDETYWGRPVPGFGDAHATIAFVGLAPAAHGANRTGRMFTGDRSGDFLYASLHRLGIASQPLAKSRDDGLELRGAFIASPVRCAPPQNKPTPDEITACAPFLDRELSALPKVRVLFALGSIAWNASLAYLERRGETIPRPKPAFGHGAEIRIGNLWLIGSYHVSQQNTQTGRLTPTMFDAVVERALELGSI